MDPDVTLHDLIDAINCADWECAYEHARNLRDWLDREGFTPVMNRDTQRALLYALCSATLVGADC